MINNIIIFSVLITILLSALVISTLYGMAEALSGRFGRRKIVLTQLEKIKLVKHPALRVI